MASQSSKKTAHANAQTLKELHVISLLVNLLSLICTVCFKRPASLWPYLFLSLPSFGCEYVLETSGRPKYTVNAGQSKLLKCGDDIKGPGLFEYLFDTVYVTWLCDILMVVFGSNKVWWLYTVIPGFTAYKLSNLVRSLMGKLRGAKAAGAETSEPTKSKRQVKAERRQETQRVGAR